MRELLRFLRRSRSTCSIVNLLMFVDGCAAQAPGRRGARTRRGRDDRRRGARRVRQRAGGASTARVQAIARIPYQLILAVTFVIFPLVSQATFDDDRATTRGYVRATMRYSLLVVARVARAGGAARGGDAPLLPARVRRRRAALALLLFGYVCFSLLHHRGTIINGAGRTLPTIAHRRCSRSRSPRRANWIAHLLGARRPRTIRCSPRPAATAAAMGVGLVARAWSTCSARSARRCRCVLASGARLLRRRRRSAPGASCRSRGKLRRCSRASLGGVVFVAVLVRHARAHRRRAARRVRKARRRAMSGRKKIAPRRARRLR